MSLRLGDDAPNFTANSSIGEINFYEYLSDSWVFCLVIRQIIHPFVPLN